MALFDKPALTIEQQLSVLSQRGLMIPDRERARQYLENVSYYRFSAYTRPFYIPQQIEHRFLLGTTFDGVLSLYIFDRELRLLLLDAIERVEVALRSQMTNCLAEHYGAHGYTAPEIFDDRYDHTWLMSKLEKGVSANNADVFVQHYRNKYEEASEYPPVWMAMEMLTFKEVSVMFSQLRHSADTQRISRHFGWPHTVLCSWFRSLSDLRNLCAHHSRVWNREFGSFPAVPRKRPKDWAQIPKEILTRRSSSSTSRITPQRRFYMQWVVMETLMRVVCPESRWSKRLVQLLRQHQQVSLFHMGFPKDWEQQAFWRSIVDD